MEHYQSDKYPCSILALSGYISSYTTHNTQTAFMSAIITALLKKRQQPESLHIIPPEPRSEWPPLHNSSPTSPAQLQWPSTPYSKPNSTKYEAYRKSAEDFEVGHLTPHAITSGLDRIKVPYGTVKRRPKTWGPNQATKSMFPVVFDHAR